MVKAISTIIATVLMLLIVIALAGTSYLFISGTLTSKTATAFEIVDSYGDTVTIRNIGTEPITSFRSIKIDDSDAVYRVDKQDNSLVGYWKMDDFDPSEIKILVIEEWDSRYANQLRDFGFSVVVDTAITTMDQVASYQPDIVVDFSHIWDVTKTGLLNELYDNGYRIYTEGNDNSNNLRPIADYVSTSQCAGTIVPVGSHQTAQGWSSTGSSGCDPRRGITSINSNAVSIAIDSTLGYIETIYLEEQGKGKWFHHQPSDKPDDRLLINAISFLVHGSTENIITVRDSSGNGNTGIFGHAPKWVDGKFGKAMSFDGVNDYVSIPSSSSLMPPYVTISAWIRPIINKDQGVVDKGWTYNIFYSSSSGIRAEFYTAGGGNGCYGDLLPLNEWSHVTITFDGSLGKLYVNGTYKCTADVPDGTLDYTRPGGSDPVSVGKYGGYFNGVTDEVGIYNKALSEQEVKANYDIGSQINAGETATIKIYNQLSKGTHTLRLCTSSMCNTAYLTIQ